MDDLSEAEKIFIYTLGVLQGLCDKGFLQGGLPLSDKGRKIFSELKESGYECLYLTFAMDQIQTALKC